MRDLLMCAQKSSRALQNKTAFLYAYRAYRGRVSSETSPASLTKKVMVGLFQKFGKKWGMSTIEEIEKRFFTPRKSPKKLDFRKMFENKDKEQMKRIAKKYWDDRKENAQKVSERFKTFFGDPAKKAKWLEGHATGVKGFLGSPGKRQARRELLSRVSREKRKADPNYATLSDKRRKEGFRRSLENSEKRREWIAKIQKAAIERFKKNPDYVAKVEKKEREKAARKNVPKKEPPARKKVTSERVVKAPRPPSTNKPISKPEKVEKKRDYQNELKVFIQKTDRGLLRRSIVTALTNRRLFADVASASKDDGPLSEREAAAFVHVFINGKMAILWQNILVSKCVFFKTLYAAPMPS